MIRICKQCNKEFNGRSRNNYCSNVCSSKNRKTGEHLSCAVCNKKFYANKHRIDTDTKHTQYCSRSCATTHRNLSKPIEKRVPKKNCIICGEEFIGYGTNKYCCSNKCKDKYQTGENSPAWKGGLMRNYPIYLQIRMSPENRIWRDFVYKRDNYTCQICFKKSNGDINAHHIEKFSDIYKRNKVKNYEDAKNCHELWDVNNGITICKECHIKIHKNAILRHN